MELDYYLWRNKISQKDFSSKLRISLSTLTQVLARKNSPSLLTAVKIVEETGGVVSFEELLRTVDRLEMIKVRDHWKQGLEEPQEDVEN